jgi:hypothetical protein
MNQIQKLLKTIEERKQVINQNVSADNIGEARGAVQAFNYVIGWIKENE